ncbi:hypothetical protein CEXT_288521 [Caerostris extrusa]|uniref:Uncharacterized protein n=1 Tax=Caerostris extrusa TaxID=172846 RepID=A0AAV4Y6J0_CAEEX|nr:hypothetical protein CEXT_288521 [Caerostris extrusa]
MAILQSYTINCYTCLTIPSFLEVEGLPTAVVVFQRLTSTPKSQYTTRRWLFSLKNSHRKLFIRLANYLKQRSPQSTHELDVYPLF